MIFDPLTAATVNGQQIRNQFAGNVIPLARFDKVSQAIQALIPNPDQCGRGVNYPADTSRPIA